jgi:transposase
MGVSAVADHAGQAVERVDARGEVRAAQVFTTVLGALSHAYAEATFTQTVSDWIGRMPAPLAFFGGVPRQIVPDNLRPACNWHGRDRTPLAWTSPLATALRFSATTKRQASAKVAVQVVER